LDRALPAAAQQTDTLHPARIADAGEDHARAEPADEPVGFARPSTRARGSGD
jgi:hypothetical protein